MSLKIVSLRITSLAALTLLTLHAAGKFCCAADKPVGPGQRTEVVVFNEGERGYPTFRIPALAVTSSGAVLAFCEARTGGDWSQIEIVGRRSTDEGQTWSPIMKIADVPGVHAKNPAALRQRGVKSGEITYNNPLVIADREQGTVHFLFCLEYARCFYQRSEDLGRTYSPPVEITSTLEKFRPEYGWQVVATGPGHGIRLKNGRLLVPVWLSTATGANVHHPSVIATIHSDDDGKTWQRGEIITGEREPLVDPNELQAVELADGRVMFNIRSLSPPNRRAVAFSPDGISNWTVPAFDPALVDPICMASLCRLSTTADSDRNRLLFSNPANLERAKGDVTPGGSRDRKNLTVRLSYDEGKTWPVSRVLEPGSSSYSDLAVAPNGTIYCLYEKRGESGNNSVYLSKFDLEWLSGGKDQLGKRE